MLVILLKSSACLAIFMLFYKLCLEKTSAHTFKRFYLIGILLISISIPFITFTEYIIVEPKLNFATNLEPQNYSHLVITETAQSKNYLPTILWSIYLIGMSIFLIRFLKNLYQLLKKIKQNPKFKNEKVFHVLLQELVTPHTFFNYIFLNKTKYENHQIPNEVLLHEQTHAKQKHALDILFIEILQILFWFNPLLYFIKKDIKLNHEFLADQAVLKHGIEASTYQNTLLAFSSNASYSSLANAINYSLIKKRFTVMKTKTSKPALWLRSLIILPLLAILIYGFSDKVIVEKEASENTYTQLNQSRNTKIELYNYLIEKRLEAEEEIRRSNIKDSTELKFINQRLNLIQKDIEANTIKDDYRKHKNPQQKATPEQLEEYNNLVNQFNSQTKGMRIIKVKDVKRIEYIFNIMTVEQKKNAEPFPDFSTVAPIPIPKPFQQKVTLKEIDEYNKLAKKFNANPEGVFKIKDINRLKFIYRFMTIEQKKIAVPFPKLIPVPIPHTLSQKTITKHIMTSSASFEPYTEIIYQGANFMSVKNEIGVNTFLATYDKSFKTPEGYSIGSQLKDISKSNIQKSYTERGYSYFIVLNSGWKLGFCEGIGCTENTPKDSSTVKWIHRKN